MRKLIFITIITLFSNMSFGQNFSELANSEFGSAESYKTAESQVLLCANYLLDNPTSKAELNRKYAIQYIIIWMTGTPDYTFEIGQNSIELTKGDDDLFALNMAAMTKVVLDNPDKKLSSDVIYNQSEKLLVDYCAVPENDIKPSKKIKKILKETKE